MADFAQNGEIGTLHNLRNRSVEDLEGDLAKWSHETPMSLVLPCLFSELEGPAMGPILDQLCHATYLEEIIIGLDRATEEQFHIAREFFSKLPQKHVILWNEGPRLQNVDATLAEKSLAPQELGKGRNVWYCLGYFLAAGHTKAVALHDCDIVTYERDILVRLLYPIVHPSFNYVFCKGYYYRAAGGRMHGRVVRLLVAPLLRAMRRTLGALDYLDFMSSFRYPLAGEFSMRAEVVPSLRIPSDWGLEIGTLSEMYRNYSHHRICQVDVADAYDHKHQLVSEKDTAQGLNRMSVDICKALIRKLAVQGVVFSPEILRTLKACYYRTALDMVDHYHNDAAMSGLTLDRHLETATIEVFAQSILTAGEAFLSKPQETPFIPSWSRVQSAFPEIGTMICEAVAADNS